ARYNQFSHHELNHNFHGNALYQYLNLFCFLVLFGYETECPSNHEPSFSAFERPHNSEKSAPFRWQYFGLYFHVKYNTLYFIFIKCVLCEAVGSADQNHKTFKTFLFFTRKKKQKNLPSATSA